MPHRQRRRPRRHTVHTSDPRYYVDQYNRGTNYPQSSIDVRGSSNETDRLSELRIHTRVDPRFKIKKDYGDVKQYNYRNRDYLIGKDEGERTLEDNLFYARKIADVLDTLPIEDTSNITYIVIDPQHSSSGELSRGMLPAEIYDPMGKKAARSFLKQHEGYGSNPNYGIIFGSEVWDENKNHLPHLVRHEVGHLRYYLVGEKTREQINDAYQKCAEQFIKIDDTDIKYMIDRVERIERVNRGSDSLIFRIDGLSNINFREDLWSKYKIPSIYSMKSPSEYFAELYANRKIS